MLRRLEERFSRRRQWGIAACGWLLAVGCVGAWVALSSPADLVAQLVAGQFWVLEALFVLVVALTIAHGRSAWRLAVNQPPLRLAGGFCVCAAGTGLVLAAAVAPQTNRIYYDEQIYQNIGQNMSDLRRTQICNDGSLEYGRLRCHEGEYNKQPYGYPYLLSIIYRVGGTRDGAAQFLNAMLAGLVVVVVFLATALLFRDSAAALFAATVMALLPEQLRWAATAAVEPSAAFFAAFAVMTAAYFVRTRTSSGLLWVVAASVWAAQFRMESGLVLGVVALIVLCGARREARRPRAYIAAGLGMLLLGPLVAHVVAVGGDSWGAYGPRTSLSYVPENLRVNGTFYLLDGRFPAFYTLLAVIGAMATRRRRLAGVVATYFLSFFAVFLVFYAGSYDYGADVRFSLTTYPAVAILAGLGAAAAARWCSRVSGLSAAGANAVVGALMVVQFSWYMPYVRSVGEEAWEARGDVEFARMVAEAVPVDAYVFSHNPNMFHVFGTSAAQTVIGVERPDYVAGLLARYRGGVYFHWGFWCNAQEEGQRDLCRRMTELYHLEVVAERRRWYQRYVLYRVAGLRDGAVVQPPAVGHPGVGGGYKPPASVEDGDGGQPGGGGEWSLGVTDSRR